MFRLIIRIAPLALLLILATTAAADPPTFTVSGTLDPLYSTNAGFTRNPQDDFLLRARLSATLKGNIENLFGYSILAGTRNDRFSDLPGLDTDFAFYGFTITKDIAEYRISLAGTHTFVYDTVFDDRRAGIFDLVAGVTRPIVILSTSDGDWTLTPGFSVGRRFSDVDRLERLELAPSIGISGPFLTGTLNLGVAYAFRPFDEFGREDSNLVMNSTWTKTLSENVTVGARAKYELNRSDIRLSSYDVFEVGPFVTVSFSTD
jgi:hypothetical protein